MGGSWPGPGRLRASIGAPWGIGPLTSSCFEQDYTAEVEIVEVFDSMPVQPGMALHDGDTIRTEPLWGEVLISASNEWIGPDSEVTFESGGVGGRNIDGAAARTGLGWRSAHESGEAGASGFAHAARLQLDSRGILGRV